MAMASRVARPERGASVATISARRSAWRPSIRSTRSAVGGSTGRPSDQRSSIAQPWKASRSSGLSTATAATEVAALAGSAGSRVRARSASDAIFSALAITSFGSMPPIGCGTSTTDRCGSPWVAD